MSVLPILRWPDPRLSQVCAPVGEVTDAVRRQAEDMLETMYAAPGRGLAAPQVGVMNRLFVMDVTWKEGTPRPVVCIDPVILDSVGPVGAGDEMCLSIPGVSASVVRPSVITLEWTGLDGVRVSQRLDAAAARCAQHELDHLDGVVTLDRLSPEARAVAEAEYAA